MKPCYEEMRLKRIEEIKKVMEKLKLNNMAQSLLAPKPSNMKKRAKPNVTRHAIDPSLIRRSSRVADKPKVNYKDDPIDPEGRSRTRSYGSGNSRRGLSNRVYASDEARENAIERAEDFLSRLGEDNVPSFVKTMMQSHVTGGFWLGLQVDFCKKHLPKHDERIWLIDENEEKKGNKYIARKTGLSAGWRGFALSHELVDGDALLFRLIQPTTFKVYIFRANR